MKVVEIESYFFFFSLYDKLEIRSPEEKVLINPQSQLIA